MKDKNTLFHLEFVYQEDVERKLKETITNLTEDQKTDFKFEDEYFYKIGGGHDFVYGFFNEYVTKKGVTATEYLFRFWVINGNEYDYKEGVFIKRPVVIYEPTKTKLDDIQFPIIRNVIPKIACNDIEPVQPKPKL